MSDYTTSYSNESEPLTIERMERAIEELKSKLDKPVVIEPEIDDLDLIFNTRPDMFIDFEQENKSFVTWLRGYGLWGRRT